MIWTKVNQHMSMAITELATKEVYVECVLFYHDHLTRFAEHKVLAESKMNCNRQKSN